MSNKDRIYVTTTAILAVCAGVLTFNNVRTTYFPAPSIPLHTFSDWRSYAERGQRMGPAHTKVVLVLFNDFECPSCRALTTTLEEIRGQYPESVSVVVRHWPIPGHRLALTAAYASICAEKFGKFGPMFRLLSANGTVSGDPDWANLAARVGITETGQFIGCMSEARTDSLVKADIADAARVGAVGTPTLLVNNEQYFGRPRRLRAIVRRHLEAQALP